MTELDTSKAANIDPNNFNNVDLRGLSNDDLKNLIANYPSLRNTPNGYNLGQKALALLFIRENLNNYSILEHNLKEGNWIFTCSNTPPCPDAGGKKPAA